MGDGNNVPQVRLTGPLLNFVTVVVGIVAGYFLTIQSLKIELAAKAEAAMVERLDHKLAGIEVLLKEGVVSRDEFYQFAKDVEARLVRIEYHVMTKTGDQSGKP